MGRKLKDLTGKTFGMFTVIKLCDEKYITESGIKLNQWLCIDKDGNEYKLLPQYLYTNPQQYKPYKKKINLGERTFTENKQLLFVRKSQQAWKEKQYLNKLEKRKPQCKTKRISKNYNIPQDNDNIKHIQKKYDLTGKIFGKWIVLEEAHSYKNKTNKYTRRKWTCKCTNILSDGSECGNICDVIEQNLISGGSSMCKECTRLFNKKVKHINIGDIYGNLKVIECLDDEIEKSDTKRLWLCECLCTLHTKLEYTGENLIKKKNKRRCGRFGCDTTKVILSDDNQFVLKRQCSQCHQLKDIDEFRSAARARKIGTYICLTCAPYSSEIDKESDNYKKIEAFERYKYYVTASQQRKINFNLSLQEFYNITKLPCFYCREFSKSVTYLIPSCGIDRLDSSKDYSIDNCIPCCTTCNIMKMDTNVFVFLQKIKEIYNRLDIINMKLQEEYKLNEQEELAKIEAVVLEKQEKVRKKHIGQFRYDKLSIQEEVANLIL